MSSPPVPNGVKVELIYTQGVQRMQNVYWVTKGSPATSADLIAIAQIFRDWEFNTVRTSRPNTTALVQIDLTAMDAGGGPVLTSFTGLPVVGTQALAAAPPYVTIAIRHSTGLSGRSRRGRTYFIGLMQSTIDVDGNVPQASATALAGFFNTLRANLLAGGWVFSVCSLYSGTTIIGGVRRAVPRAAGILTPITTSTCERGTDTQRHRKLPQGV